MKNKSRIIGLLLVGSLFVTTIANAEVFSATKPGFGGDVMVSITVEDQKIVDCQIAGDQETAGIGSRAVEEMPALIVAGEGNADVVSGATITSNAILEALGDAMVQSGLREADSGEIAYTPGTYTAVVAARNGEMTVETTFSEDTIERIEILSHIETPGVSDVALERVPSEIIELQTLDVDTTTGATVSRAAVIAAVRNCVEQAGGNV